MNDRSRPCRRWRRRIGLLALHELGTDPANSVKEHLEGCVPCTHYFSQLRALEHHLASVGKELPPLEPSTELRGRWQSAVLTSSRPGEAMASLGAEGAGWWTALGAWLPGGNRSWVAIAGCWLLIALFRWTSPVVDNSTVTTTTLPLHHIISVLGSQGPGIEADIEPTEPDQAIRAIRTYRA